MTSLLTNNSAMIALQTMRSINNQLETTNNSISTGKTINNAADGAAYWSIATTLTSDNGALKSVKDAMSLDKNLVDATDKGLSSVLTSLDTIKQKLASATSQSQDRGKIQTEIASILSTIKTTSDNSVMNGKNWLSVDTSATGYTADKSILSSFSRQGTTVDVDTTNLDIGAFALYDSNSAASTITSTISAMGNIVNAISSGLVSASSVKGFMDTTYDYTAGAVTGTVSIQDIDISKFDDSTASVDKLQMYIKIVDATMQELQKGSASLGTTSSRIGSQQTLIQGMMDLNKASIGSLVDADMEQQATSLKALQTQQQLAIQSLSIANSSSSNVLTLFRG